MIGDKSPHAALQNDPATTRHGATPSRAAAGAHRRGAGLTRRGLLGGGLAALGAFASGAAMAQAPARSLRPVLRPSDLGRPKVPSGEDLVSAARLDARVGYTVADATTGKVLETRAGDEALPPASVAKALTAMYALDVLGPDHRFATEVLATGPVEDGVLRGDLVLAGGGDPTLETDHLATLADGLRDAGVREVTGAFIVWGGALPFETTIDVEQPDHVGYSPAVSGLNLNYNRVHFEWRKAGKGWEVSMDARSARYRPDVTVAKMRVANRDLPVYTYDDTDGADAWTVAQGQLGNGGARWLPVRKPELYAGEVFRTFARSHGIVLPEALATRGARPEGSTLARHESGDLAGILKDMLLYSTNLTAEAVGMSASMARFGALASMKDSAAAMNFWAETELGLATPALVDHSGLGGDNRITTEDMVRALVAAHGRGRLPDLLKSIAPRDDSLPLDIHAKTGTLNFVSGLAGFVTAADGTDLAFAIFAADVPRREALPEAQRERPSGGREWNGRARLLQHALIARWGKLYAMA